MPLVAYVGLAFIGILILLFIIAGQIIVNYFIERSNKKKNL